MELTFHIEPIPRILVALAPPSNDHLLDLLRSRVSRLMLEEIAANDYGEEVPAYLAGIEAQLAPDVPLGRLSGCPLEVLQLQAWCEPDDLPDAAREHTKRMLACTILLRHAGSAGPKSAEDEYSIEVSANVVLQLVRSIMRDSQVEPLSRAGLALLLWLYNFQPFPRLQPFAAFGALMLGAYRKFGGAAESDIQAACSWVNAVEARCRTMIEQRSQSEPWLLGLNAYVDLKDRRRYWMGAARTAFSGISGTSEETRTLFEEMLHRLDT